MKSYCEFREGHYSTLKVLQKALKAMFGFTILVLSHLVSPGQRAVKRV